MNKQIIIYSHGFGVRKDDRGLFKDIASALPDSEHIMFDYNQFDSENNTLIVTPINQQALILFNEVKKAKINNPDAILDLVCHSQGCVVAALANLAGIRKTIFLAPPISFLGAKEKLEQMGERPGTVTENGVTSYPRRDGSTTIIKDDYWSSREGIVPVELYNQLAKTIGLTIIRANQDEVLGNADYSDLSYDINVINIDANHDFTGETRSKLCKLLTEIMT